MRVRAGRLTLLCQGATADTRGAVFATPRTPLEAAALARLPSLRARLPDDVAVAVAPSRAAQDTAEALGFGVAVEPLLQDCDFGRWAGQPVTAVVAEDAAAFQRWRGDPCVAPHGGESLVALVARMRQWLVACEADQGPRLAVASPLVVRAAVVAALALPPTAIFGLDAEPLGVTRLTHGGGFWRLAQFNATV